MEVNLDRRVSLGELASRLGVTVEAVRIWRRAGRLPEPHRDYPTGRPYYLASEAERIIKGDHAQESNEPRAAA